MSMFSFLDPFSVEIWIYMAVACFVVPFVMYVAARISTPTPKNVAGIVAHTDDEENVSKESKTLEVGESNIGPKLTLGSSFWIVFSSLFCKGTDNIPRAVSARCVVGIWWFFVITVACIYIATVGPFLRYSQEDLPMDTVEDLAEQSDIKYGSVKGGSTYAFFKDNVNEPYARMANQMMHDPEVFTKTNSEGIDRVLNSSGNYAFILESPSAQYPAGQNCDLYQVGGLLNSKGYGIAVAPNSPLLNDINIAILRLNEAGVIEQLEYKWFHLNDMCPRYFGGNRRVPASTHESVYPLTVENVGGVFILLLVGLVISILIAILEFCWNKYGTSKEEKYTVKNGSIK